MRYDPPRELASLPPVADLGLDAADLARGRHPTGPALRDVRDGAGPARRGGRRARLQPRRGPVHLLRHRTRRQQRGRGRLDAERTGTRARGHRRPGARKRRRRRDLVCTNGVDGLCLPDLRGKRAQDRPARSRDADHPQHQRRGRRHQAAGDATPRHQLADPAAGRLPDPRPRQRPDGLDHDPRAVEHRARQPPGRARTAGRAGAADRRLGDVADRDLGASRQPVGDDAAHP